MFRNLSTLRVNNKMSWQWRSFLLLRLEAIFGRSHGPQPAFRPTKDDMEAYRGENATHGDHLHCTA
jgi:hypothetical protein